MAMGPLVVEIIMDSDRFERVVLRFEKQFLDDEAEEVSEWTVAGQEIRERLAEIEPRLALLDLILGPPAGRGKAP